MYACEMKLDMTDVLGLQEILQFLTFYDYFYFFINKTFIKHFSYQESQNVVR